MTAKTTQWGISFKVGATAPAPAFSGRAAPALSAADTVAQAHQLWMSGQLEDALQAAKTACRIDPNNAEAHGLVGGLASELDRPWEGEPALVRALDLSEAGTEQWAHVASLLGTIYAGCGRWGDAEKLARQIEDIKPTLPSTVHRLGLLYVRINSSARGIPYLETAVEAAPTRPDFHLSLGNAYRFMGRLDESEGEYETSVSLDPNRTETHRALSELKRWTPETAHIERLEALSRRFDLSVLDRARVGFALFKEYQDIGAREKAWTALVHANEAMAQHLPPWSAQRESEWYGTIKAAFSDLPPPGPTRHGCPRPIFIVGLPRSGTTLVERILAAHSGVTAMGELLTFPQVITWHGGVRYLEPFASDAASAIDWDKVAEAYRSQTAFLSTGASHAIDKLPHNTEYIGAILHAFPDAAIVHVRRNPMDCLFGSYKRIYYGFYEWAFKLDTLAAHYRNHVDLMGHWKSMLQGRLIDVEYEALVADPETEIRRLLADVGLAFEEACLYPHETAGEVATASAVQVRRPINAEGIGSWRKYEQELLPLATLLGE